LLLVVCCLYYLFLFCAVCCLAVLCISWHRSVCTYCHKFKQVMAAVCVGLVLMAAGIELVFTFSAS